MVTQLQNEIRTNYFKSLSHRPSFPRVFYWLLLINLVIDVLFFWSEPGGVTALVRAVILYSVFGYLLLIKRIRWEINPYILIFSIFVCLQFPLAFEIDYSLKVSIQVITSLLMFFVGFALIKNEFDFRYYLKQFFWIYIVIVANTIVSNIFDFGLDDYTKSTDYVVGGLNDLWNSYTYSLIMLPLLLVYRVEKKIILYVSAFLVFVFLLISLKRIAILGVFVASILFLVFVGIKTNILKRIVIGIIILAVTSPLYFDLLSQRIQIRAEQGRFSSNFYEDEGRYLEFQYLIDQTMEFKKPLEILFGLRAFDSRGIVGDGNRQFHVDYTLITFTLGLVGLILYLLMYFQWFRLGIKVFRHLKSLGYRYLRFKMHLATYFILLITSLVTSIGGQMYHVTFRVMIFMTTGVLLKLLLLEVKRTNYLNVKHSTRL